MKILLYPIMLCFMVVQLLPFSSHAETDWQEQLLNYIRKIHKEYSYYATLNDDGNDFPASREQEIIAHIKNNFLKEHANEPLLIERINILASVPSIAIAKLLLHYGGNVWEGGEYKFFPIIFASKQGIRYRELSHNLSHAEVIDIINQGKRKWANHLPSNNAIMLNKLYLANGADIHQKDEYRRDAISESLYEYYIPYERLSYDIRPSYTHRADDLEPPYIPEAEADEAIYYYRSPVTYWLEEFIAAGYPASMLDTHKLHYPRFMKDASVAQVTEMLTNPDAHKIPNNINCPYKAEAMDCPLTPSINMRDAMGRTPLHIAAEQGNKAVFDALIQIGADSTIKDYRGLLPKL